MTDRNAGPATKMSNAGKKNSTIHLLSGGEKALTALALIFAIILPPLAILVLVAMMLMTVASIARRSLLGAPIPGDFELVEAGIARHLVIGLGARGSVGVSADEQILTSRPVEKPLSAVGAGDSFVGAYALAIANGEDFATALVHGTAAAASAVLTPGTQLCDGDLAVSFRAEVATTRL